MSEKDFDFDRQLIDRLSELPPPDEDIRDTNPWSRPINSITTGLILTTLHLNFLYLQYILPTIGVILIFLGFRSLRRENKYFRAAWILSIVKLVLQLYDLVKTATPLNNADVSEIAIGAVMLVFQIALLLIFQKALEKVYRKAGKETEDKPLRQAALWTAAAFFIALSPLAHSWLSFIPMIICYILIARSLFRIGEELDDTGYLLKNAPVRISDKIFGRAYFLVAFVTVIICCVVSNHLPLKPQEFRPPVITQTRQHLLDMGFPEQALPYLNDDDVSQIGGAINIEAISGLLMFDAIKEEHRVTYGNHTQVTVTNRPGKQNLNVTTVYIEMPESVVYILQYFAWEGGRPLWQDGIQISGENKAEDWRIVSSGLFYSKKGGAYTADFPRLTCGERTQAGFFGPSRNIQIIGGLSYPFGSRDQGGYVLYRYQLKDDGDIYVTCALINYLHLSSPIHLPYMDTEDRMLTGAYLMSDAKQQHYTSYESFAFRQKNQ